MAAPVVLQVEDVTLEYTNGGRVVRATERVSFEQRADERLVLLGPSGCGKSSLLKAIAGFAVPAAGHILLDGTPVRGPGPDRVVVFQEFDQLPPWKTVRGNVMFPLLASRRAERADAHRRADAALERVGLAAFADAWPHTLSGGMKQRVAIARALVMQPRLLLMDEPFAALDALTRQRMQQELLALWAQTPHALVFVTHSIEEAVILGHRIVLLSPHPGRVRAIVDVPPSSPHGPGRAAFEALVQRIHALVFAQDPMAREAA